MTADNNLRAHSEQETLRIEEEGRMIMIINAFEVAPNQNADGWFQEQF